MNCILEEPALNFGDIYCLPVLFIVSTQIPAWYLEAAYCLFVQHAILNYEEFRLLGCNALWHNITEDGILHSHRLENLISYTALTGWTL
jgi:hypothetical protein